MSTLLDRSPSVHSNPPIVRRITPLELLDPTLFDDEPFHPSPADLAYDLAYTQARKGEPNACPTLPYGHASEIYLAHYKGQRAGMKARDVDQARELGYEVGLISEISEPPGGMSPDEAKAYRAGFAAGRAEADDDARTEAWVEYQESLGIEDALAVVIRDADVYPMGCMS